jgi:hypothetical protein
MVRAQGALRAARSAKLFGILEDIARRTNEPVARAQIAYTRALDAFYLGRFGETCALVDEAARIYEAECNAVAFEVSLTFTARARAHFITGDLTELKRCVKQLIESADTRRNLLTFARCGLAVGAWLADDDLDEMERQAAIVAPELASQSTTLYPHALNVYGRTLAALYKREGRSAHALLDAEWETIRGAYLFRLQWLRILFWELRARAALAHAREVGGPARVPLVQEVRRCMGILDKERLEWAAAVASLIGAEIALLEGDQASAALRFEDAARRADGTELFMHAAVARLRAAELTESHVGALDAARARMHALGARTPERFARILAPVSAHDVLAR